MFGTPEWYDDLLRGLGDKGYDELDRDELTRLWVDFVGFVLEKTCFTYYLGGAILSYFQADVTARAGMVRFTEFLVDDIGRLYFDNLSGNPKSPLLSQDQATALSSCLRFFAEGTSHAGAVRAGARWMLMRCSRLQDVPVELSEAELAELRRLSGEQVLAEIKCAWATMKAPGKDELFRHSDVPDEFSSDEEVRACSEVYAGKSFDLVDCFHKHLGMGDYGRLQVLAEWSHCYYLATKLVCFVQTVGSESSDVMGRLYGFVLRLDGSFWMHGGFLDFSPSQVRAIAAFLT